MTPGKAQKRVAMFVLVLIALVLGSGEVRTGQNCDSPMVFVPAGSFYAGIDDEEFEYVLHLCNVTIGNCYSSWFEYEKPRREVKNNAFCMDRYEYPNRQGEYPMTGVSFDNAKKLCEGQGKRLCTQVEWESACQGGPLDNDWTYGHIFRQGVCNDYSTGLLPSGYKSACMSANGANDLNGNVAEWVEGDVAFTAGGMVERYKVLKGGSYRQRPIFSRCSYVDAQSPDRAHVDFGFRCCDDTNAQKVRRAEPLR